jgi:DNA polymerase V
MTNFSDMADSELYKRIKRFAVQEHFGMTNRTAELDAAFSESERRFIARRDGAVRDTIFNMAVSDALATIYENESAMFGMKVSSLDRLKFEPKFGNENPEPTNPAPDRPARSDIDFMPVFGSDDDSLLVCRVSGESMVNANINEGDTLIADTSVDGLSDSEIDGKIIIASVRGNLFVKRFRIGPDGARVLVSENDKYPDYIITPDSDFVLYGLVKHIVHEMA